MAQSILPELEDWNTRRVEPEGFTTLMSALGGVGRNKNKNKNKKTLSQSEAVGPALRHRTRAECR